MQRGRDHRVVAMLLQPDMVDPGQRSPPWVIVTSAAQAQIWATPLGSGGRIGSA